VIGTVASSEEQLLDDHLGHRVLTLTEVMESDPAFLVGDVERRPVVVRERGPNRVVGVDRDGILHAEGPRLRGDVLNVPFEIELGGVDADYGEAVVVVLRVPAFRRGHQIQVRGHGATPPPARAWIARTTHQLAANGGIDRKPQDQDLQTLNSRC
jgi:hypothetical protein